MPVTVEVAARLKITSTVAVRQIFAFRLRERSVGRRGEAGCGCSVRGDVMGAVSESVAVKNNSVRKF
jgi:hypothetical protein